MGKYLTEINEMEVYVNTMQVQSDLKKRPIDDE